MTDEQQPPASEDDVDSRLSKLVQYMLDRATEASSMRGFLTALTLLGGVVINPDKIEAVVLTATGISAGLKILLPDDLTPVFKAVRATFQKLFAKVK